MSYIVFGSMLITLCAVAVFIPRLPASLFGYAAMWLCRWGGIAYFSNETMLFWGVAAAIATGIPCMLPRQIARSRVGLTFIAGGALAGAAVGISANSMAAVIVGSACGALFGGMAFANTQAGRQVLTFPSKKFFNYLAAKGLPAVVALAMAAACIAQLVNPTGAI